MKKWIIRIVLGLVVLFAVGVACVFMFLNSIVKTGIEKVGPAVTGVPITIEGVNLSVFSGMGEIKGLVMGNPPGYKSATAIKVGATKVNVDPKSVFSDKVVVQSVNVVSPEITVEGGMKDNNLTKIMANLNASVSAVTGTNAPPSTQKGSKKLQVNELNITGAKLNLQLGMLGGKEMNLPLPDIHLTNLGTGENGITPAEVVAKVFNSVLEGTGKAMVSAVGNSVGDIGKGALDVTKGAGQGAKDTVKGVLDIFKK
jgi:uncharacterized protein involved in outer membrane biogenesis